MSVLIKDEFTSRTDISRQRRYQLRHDRDGLCELCPAPAIFALRCARHVIEERERQRIYKGCKRRNLRARSYQFDFERRLAA
jgi:hypothetical protein